MTTSRADDPAADTHPDTVSGGGCCDPDPTTDDAAREAACGRAGDLEEQVADLTDQLLRSRADFVNFRRRTETQRAADRTQAVAGLLGDLVGVLDDIDRAEAHDELVGGLGAVCRRLRDQLTSAGLVRYGRPGDVFDPAIHNAVAHLPVGDVDEPVCLDVVAPGYTYHGVPVRVAHVAVATRAEPDTN